MPKPTQYVPDNGSDAAYEYNYIYDYPIGDFPMYFPIRGGYPDLPKNLYIMEEQPIEQSDFSNYYIAILLVLSILLVLLVILLPKFS